MTATTSFTCPAWCDGDTLIEEPDDGTVLGCTHQMTWNAPDMEVIVERWDEPGRALRKPSFAIDSAVNVEGRHDIDGLTETHVLCLIDALIKALADVRGTTVDAVIEEVRALD